MLPVDELGLPTSVMGAADEDFRYDEEDEAVKSEAFWPPPPPPAEPDRPPELPDPVGLSDHEFRWYDRWLERKKQMNEMSVQSITPWI